MKLHHLLQKCSFFLIKLAAVQASGCARMKLHKIMSKKFTAFQQLGYFALSTRFP
jgi:hypothetical protein